MSISIKNVTGVKQFLPEIRRIMKKFFIVDGSSCFYRAFHALPVFTNSAGLPTNAVYGFTQTLRKLIKDYSPDYMLVALDSRGPTHRHALYESYKATRPSMPDDLVPQIPYIKEMVKALNIAHLEKEGLEADDIIAQAARLANAKGFLKTYIISGDKDLYQLVNDKTVILDYVKDRELGEAEVREKFGVAPGRIADLLALAGDSSDNVPGVPGIGVKTAAKLIEQFGGFDEIYASVEEVSGKKVKENLINFRDQALLSRELVQLMPDTALEMKTETELEIDIESMPVGPPETEALKKILKELEFTKLYNELIPEGDDVATDFTVVTSAEEFRAAMPGLFKALGTPAAAGGGKVALYPLLEGNGTRARLLGIGVYSGEGAAEWAGAGAATDGEAETEATAATDGAAAYIPVSGGDDGGNDSEGGYLSEAKALSILREVTGSDTVSLVTNDAKTLHTIFHKNSLSLIKPPTMDISLASYLIDPSSGNHDIESEALRRLGLRLLHSGKKLKDVDVGDFPQYAASRAEILYKLSAQLEAEAKTSGCEGLLTDMELPLAEVLASMEFLGVKVDAEKLKTLSEELMVEIKALEEAIYSLSGREFNINSPKQLAVLLFEEMGIKPVKKTKTGFSTDESVLKTLSGEVEIAGKILSYRGLTKLKSTFVDGITALIDPSTGRVHTTFNQTVAATGRLSSSNPNLQNIPVRDGHSARVRESFIPGDGFAFLSADYSQIELRLVAHMSGDPVLLEAFREGKDIHAITASEVFGIMPGLVTKEMRRRAKAINFGIIYGMGPFGLASDLDISVKEAGEYIESYFDHYKLVKEFIDKTIDGAREAGFTETLFGRRRFIPELGSKAPATRRFGERIAVNTPIQGTAADMIKAAMVTIYKRLKAEGFLSRMLLQVHDELIFEVPPEEEASLSSLVTEEMEGVMELTVPIKVNIKKGPNWRQVD